MGKKYLNELRINLEALNLKFLDKIVAKHLSMFSFNNVDILLTNSLLSLETKDLFNKIVIDERGGYCFEHNKLFYEVLKSLRFEVSSYLGRVVYRKEGDEIVDVPRTHRITIAVLRGEKFLVDVGFGAQGPTSIIKIDGQKHTASNGEIFRVIENDNKVFSLQQIKKYGALTLYEFDFGEYSEIDFDVAHFYTNRFPQSKFVTNLICVLNSPEETRIINNLQYSIKKSGSRNNSDINTPEELQTIINDDFYIDLSLKDAKKLFLLASRSSNS